MTVTTAGGTSATSSQDKYTYLKPPIFAHMSPTAGPLSGGTQVTIGGTDLDSVTEVDFGGVAATEFTINSAYQITATSPAEAAGSPNVTLLSLGAAGGKVVAGPFTFTAAPIVSTVTPTCGPYEGGTAVTITGMSLATATAVAFGGVPATSFTVNPDGSITAVSPAGPLGSNPDVIVTTPDGVSGTSANDKFTYALVAPRIDLLAPSTGPATGATVVTITGAANLLGATEVDFGNTKAASFTVDSSTQIVAVSPSGVAGTVAVLVFTPGEESSISDPDQFTYTAVSAISSVSPSSGPVGAGTMVTITGTNLAGATAVNFGGVAGTIVSTTNASADGLTYDASLGTLPRPRVSKSMMTLTLVRTTTTARRRP